MAEPQKYYLPYNFVPVTGTVNDKPVETVEWDDFEQGGPAIAEGLPRHDIYLPHLHSGELRCELEVLSPMVTGNIHTPHPKNKEITEIKQYSVKGKAAVAGNSLRGLISSVVEVISQSSLRVLDDDYWGIFSEIEQDPITKINLQPFNNSKKSLTPAERIFGTSSLNDDASENNGTHRAYASRVRFSDAMSELDLPTAQHNAIKMNSLASPKVCRSPTESSQKDHKEDGASTYFLRTRSLFNQGMHIGQLKVTRKEVREYLGLYDKNEKGAFDNPNKDKKASEKTPPDFVANGRKFYLAHTHNGYEDLVKRYDDKHVEKRYHSEYKTIIKPIKAGTRFHFTITFNNLSDAELSLIKTALSPSKSFTHAVGHAKNLGFGEAKIHLNEVKLKDTSYSSFFATTPQKTKDDSSLIDDVSLHSLIHLREQSKSLGSTIIESVAHDVQLVRWRLLFEHDKVSPLLPVAPKRLLPIGEANDIQNLVKDLTREDVGLPPIKNNPILSVLIESNADKFSNPENFEACVKNKAMAELICESDNTKALLAALKIEMLKVDEGYPFNFLDNKAQKVFRKNGIKGFD